MLRICPMQLLLSRYRFYNLLRWGLAGATVIASLIWLVERAGGRTSGFYHFF